VSFSQIACVCRQLCFGKAAQFFIAKAFRRCTAADSDTTGVGVGHETRLPVAIAQYAVRGLMANTAQGQKLVAIRCAGIKVGPRGGQGLEVDSLAGKGAGGAEDGRKFPVPGCKDRIRRE
jgi:hypothetical protein